VAIQTFVLVPAGFCRAEHAGSSAGRHCKARRTGVTGKRILPPLSQLVTCLATCHEGLRPRTNEVIWVGRSLLAALSGEETTRTTSHDERTHYSNHASLLSLPDAQPDPFKTHVGLTQALQAPSHPHLSTESTTTAWFDRTWLLHLFRCYYHTASVPLRNTYRIHELHTTATSRAATQACSPLTQQAQGALPAQEWTLLTHTKRDDVNPTAQNDSASSITWFCSCRWIQ
jgi:hypothetical protein